MYQYQIYLFESYHNNTCFYNLYDWNGLVKERWTHYEDCDGEQNFFMTLNGLWDETFDQYVYDDHVSYDLFREWRRDEEDRVKGVLEQVRINV